MCKTIIQTVIIKKNHQVITKKAPAAVINCMEDFEDAEEANEEDLVLLNDDFAHVKVLVTHIKDLLN